MELDMYTSQSKSMLFLNSFNHLIDYKEVYKEKNIRKDSTKRAALIMRGSCILIAYISVWIFIFSPSEVSMIPHLLLFYFLNDRQQSKPKSHFTCIKTQ